MQLKMGAGGAEQRVDLTAQARRIGHVSAGRSKLAGGEMIAVRARRSSPKQDAIAGWLSRAQGCAVVAQPITVVVM